jgi:hypothetical protein
MDMVRETMNIGNICRESVPEVFNRALQEIFYNIDDINTPPEQARKLKLEFTFTPSATREVGEISFRCKTELAGIKTVAGNFFLAKPAKGGVRGYARDPKQDELFAEQPPASDRPS